MTHSEIIHPDITLDKIAPAGRIGLIALATDFNSEQDLRRMLPQGVEIFTNRVLNQNPLNLQNLRSMAEDITRAAGGILPGMDLDVIIYGCTSGTIANGSEKIEQLIHMAKPGVKVSNPVSSTLSALSHLNARRISILTPYIEEVNLEMVAYFKSSGIEVINITGLDFENDIEIAGIPPKVIKSAALKAYHKEADCLFISCTALRASMVVEEIEQALGIPVICSNTALIWHCLQKIKYKTSIPGYGKLLR